MVLSDCSKYFIRFFKKTKKSKLSLDPVKFEKCADNAHREDICSRFDAAIRLLLKLVAEIEVYLSNMIDKDIQKYQRILPVVSSSMGRFIKLAEHLVSPGKPGMEGGVCDSSC